MFSTPEYTQNVSLQLSKVLNGIGVNEIMVWKRRRTELCAESLGTIVARLHDYNVTKFHFGSRTEGTTTLGLLPDFDTLVCHNHFNIIQDIAEWQPGFINLLMIRDDSTPPGYCLLQKTDEDVPVPAEYVPNDIFVRDRRGRILMTNTWSFNNIPEGFIRRGPAHTIIGQPGYSDNDTVHAYYCKSWPLEALTWLQRQSVGHWPPYEIKRASLFDGCFVVPVGRTGTVDEELQWRISTSLTERKLMFSLNITQIRCYVLMKMILRSFHILTTDDALSSFICKTVLLHCIATTQENFWQENNLLTCLNVSLTILWMVVYFENCPHFIIHENNLMEGRISAELKPQILEIISQIISSNGRALLGIQTDFLGMLLSFHFNRIQQNGMNDIQAQSAIESYLHVSGSLLWNLAGRLSKRYNQLLLSLAHCNTRTALQFLLQSVNTLVGMYQDGNEFIQIATKLLMPLLYTSLGTVLVSNNLSTNGIITQEAVAWFFHGLKSDVSSKLKLASIIYCTGDMQRTELILKNIEHCCDLKNVQSMCVCNEHGRVPNKAFDIMSAFGHEENVLHNTAFRVRFLPCEFNCIPEELQHELFRSEYDIPYFRREDDSWMDLAVVDSLPLFYFLQYNVYSHLEDQEKQQRAMDNFRRIIDTDPNLGHRETALNLLGQCMEQSYRLDDALRCYSKSKSLRHTNNAANFHICHLLYEMYDVN
ncbi:uncharacterized protein LOC128556914 [Mercenaria mercenaria]|uniref:uncharacterized protein LOC128556914 n=1 Tax=Mercenaria mercenaria TaxID=6596 RepID=UPI00234F193D|nr:uncharacterized protein LOC128556914 [Mercenaria mercenaria]